MPSHVVVIGGGFAGLRAAVSLADAGIRVTVAESRVGLGGRARSFTDPVTGEVVDNGQHLFLSSYERTRAFLHRLGTDRQIVYQPRLHVRFVQPRGPSFVLDCPPLPSPWHLLFGMWRLPVMEAADRRSLVRIWREVRHPASSKDDEETVDQWLARLGQGERVRSSFWRPLTVAALNEEPTHASAAGLKSVLRVVLQKPSRDSRLGMACVGLSDLYAGSAREIVEEAGGEVLLNRPATAFLLQDGCVRGVRFAGGTPMEADAVVSALPPSALRKILPQSHALELAARLDRFRMSPILSVNLWFDRPFCGDDFTALLGTRYQWVFNKAAILARAGIEAQYISLIISAAYDALDRPNEELVRWAEEEVKGSFPEMETAKLLRSQVVREREATVSLGVGMERFRPGSRCELRNLFLAGDWTATGLPATLESAVVSGEACAREVLTCMKRGKSNT